HAIAGQVAFRWANLFQYLRYRFSSSPVASGGTKDGVIRIDIADLALYAIADFSQKHRHIATGQNARAKFLTPVATLLSLWYIILRYQHLSKIDLFLPSLSAWPLLHLLSPDWICCVRSS